MKRELGFLDAREAGTQAEVIPMHRDVDDAGFWWGTLDLADKLSNALCKSDPSLRDSSD